MPGSLFTMPGLIVRETQYKDADTILTILTPLEGVVSAKARGVRRKNSPLAAGCQLYTMGEFTVFDSAGKLTIDRADIIESFVGLRRDIERLSLAAYFCEVAEMFAASDALDDGLFRVLLNMLYALAYRDTPLARIKSAFELRLAAIGGFTPDLSCCAGCGEPSLGRDDMYISVSDGQLVCEECKSYTASFDAADTLFPASAAVLDSIRHITTCDSKKLLSPPITPLSEHDFSALCTIAEAYLLAQAGHPIHALAFYKKL